MAATQRRQARYQSQCGVTLIELSVVMALVVIVIGLALPSFAAAIERHTLRGVADELEFDAQWARSAAQASGRSLRLTVQSNASTSCYVIHSGARGDCDCLGGGVKAVCQGGEESFKTVFLPASATVQLHANTSSMQFEPRRGIVTPAGSIDVVTRHGDRLRKVLAITGRMRSCSPNATVSGVPAC